MPPRHKPTSRELDERLMRAAALSRIVDRVEEADKDGRRVDVMFAEQDGAEIWGVRIQAAPEKT